MEFSEKVAVVSGAGSGIGRALTLELLRRGAHVKPTAPAAKPARFVYSST